MKTKPRGIWATFRTECVDCGGVILVTNGRPEEHTHDFRARNLEAVREEIDKPLTLADITFPDRTIRSGWD